MNENEQKSVWLKLVLPICLGVFATAIYHNAIKTQKIKVDGFVTEKLIRADEVIGPEQWDKLFTQQPLTLHAETPTAIKNSFKLKKPKSGFGLTVMRQIEKGTFVSLSDFKSDQ